VAGIDPGRFVFLDETGAKTNMTRLRGRCEGGKRLVASAPHGHWCSTTLLGAMRLDGSTAAMVIESATDQDVFLAYVREILTPTLRPGDIVVMDNLSPHKAPAVAELIRAAGADVWYLPPYSPDLNPIEQMWSKVKALLRKAAARTSEALLQAIANALDAVSASDASGWFLNCGYAGTQC
jgi:transposase